MKDILEQRQPPVEHQVACRDCHLRVNLDIVNISAPRGLVRATFEQIEDFVEDGRGLAIAKVDITQQEAHL